MGYTYSLRIALCPDYMAEEKFSLLLDFCKKARIDDVQFFLNMEEINDGHLTMEETKPWLDMIASFIPRLRSQGIGVSLNPWTTTLHTDRGRKLKAGQNFTTMVDYKGNHAQAVACPLCENFSKYLSEMYSAYAELGFDVIWIEDDFRLHNHSPLEWGGCFCEHHMREFEKRAGRKLERETFIKNITQCGVPHPDRQVWLDTMGKTMDDFAELLGDAVHSVSPNTRVALMSSAPQNHAVEGRHWQTVFSNLSGGLRPLNRPHLPAYNEVSGRQYCLEFQRYSRLTASVVPKTTELWPEVDNLPHTRFAKSHRFMQLEMESSLSLCAEGITLNIFDMIGNGICNQEENDQVLAGIKPYLEGVLELHANREQEQGICVLVDPDTVSSLYASDGDGPQTLMPWQTFWAEYLSAMGIANHMALKPRAGEIVAVSGQYLRGCTPDQIRGLAAEHFLLLDGESAEILCQSGCGDLIGAKDTRWLSLNGGGHSYEQVEGGRWVHGLPSPRISAQAIYEKVESGDYLHITYDTQPEELTGMYTAKGEKAGPGLCKTGNAIVLPYGHMKNSYQMLLNPIRRDLLSELLQPYGIAYIQNAQFVTINHFHTAEGMMVLLTNYATDDLDAPQLCLPFHWTQCRQVQRSNGKLIPQEVERKGTHVVVKHTLRSMESCCLLFR